MTRVRRRAQAGFTLVELMISLVIFSFAIAGVLSVAVSMAQGFRDQRAAVAAEGATRVPTDFIADALRQGSPGAPTGIIVDSNTCTTSALTVTNNVGGTGIDQLDLIYASGAVVTSARTVYTPGTSATLDVNDASQLSVGDYVVISNALQGHLVKITGIAGSTLTFNGGSAYACAAAPPTGGNYATGSLVIRAQHGIFFVGAVDGVPTLMLNPMGDPTQNATQGQPLAEGIEDMQIALAIDPTSNPANPITEIGSAPNDDDWVGNVSGDNPIAGTLRAVRVTLIAKTTSGYLGNTNPFNRPAAEDHTAGTTFDNYRRRVLHTIVEIRNIGESP